MACQHFPDDQTRLQAGAGEDDVIHLPSGLDRVDCQSQEEDTDDLNLDIQLNTPPDVLRSVIGASAGYPGAGIMEATTVK